MGSRPCVVPALVLPTIRPIVGAKVEKVDAGDICKNRSGAKEQIKGELIALRKVRALVRSRGPWPKWQAEFYF